MKKQLPEVIERGRLDGEGVSGIFRVVCPTTGRELTIIAGHGADWSDAGMSRPAWDHVSACRNLGVPSWEEMCWLQEQFFEPTEWVAQYHPAAADYVNIHPNVLHLWRLADCEFPTPPKECV